MGSAVQLPGPGHSDLLSKPSVRSVLLVLVPKQTPTTNSMPNGNPGTQSSRGHLRAPTPASPHTHGTLPLRCPLCRPAAVYGHTTLNAPNLICRPAATADPSTAPCPPLSLRLPLPASSRRTLLRTRRSGPPLIPTSPHRPWEAPRLPSPAQRPRRQRDSLGEGVTTSCHQVTHFVPAPTGTATRPQ